MSFSTPTRDAGRTKHGREKEQLSANVGDRQRPRVGTGATSIHTTPLRGETNTHADTQADKSLSASALSFVGICAPADGLLDENEVSSTHRSPQRVNHFRQGISDDAGFDAEEGAGGAGLFDADEGADDADFDADEGADDAGFFDAEEVLS
jgi:hypothetical protein